MCSFHKCDLYLICNIFLSLRPIDVEFMLNIHEKVNVIPIISKADMLTEKEKSQIKQRINDSIKSHEIKVNSMFVSLNTVILNLKYTYTHFKRKIIFTFIIIQDLKK